MKRGYSFVLLLAAVALVSSYAVAQLSGTKNIPGDYADLAAAITDLNTQGAGAGGVVLNLLAGNPQTAPAGGYTVTTLTGTAGNPIVIQGNANAITASAALTAGNLNDAIFKIIGADYVTITGFTLQENPANTVTTAASNNMTEWGVALLYATTTDGAQNCTIQNNTITLNRTYQNTFGIYSNSTHSASAPTTSATATTAAGGNSGLKVYGNVVSNVNNGIVVVGPTAAADHNNVVDIGGSSGATGNTISNFGTTGTFSSYANVSGTVYGILVRNSTSINVSYNSITSSAGGVTSGTLRGIYVPSFSTAPTGTFTNTINNNSLSLTDGASGTMQGITVESSTGTATATLSISNNDFTAFTCSVASSGTFTVISDAMPNLTTTINNNTLTNLSTNTTGSFTFISHSFTMPTGGSTTINNNSIVTGFNKTGAGGTVTFATTGASSVNGSTATYNGNNFSNITVTGATGITGITSSDGLSSGTSTKTVTGNTFSSWTGGTSALTAINISYFHTGTHTVSSNTITNLGGQGAITGISINASANSATSLSISSNIINNLSSTGTGGAVIGLTCANTSPSISINNNAINTLSSTGTSTAVTGLAVTGATTTNVFKNKVYDLSSAGTTPLVSGLLISSGTTVNAYNNLIGDLRAASASNGTTDVIRGINITSSTATSNLNISYNTVYLNATGGANFTTSGIFHTTSATATTAALNLIDNVIVNNSTPSGTGLAIAYRRSSTTLTNYGATSNNNDFYAGTPDASHLIFYDGTNADQTIGALKTRVTPRDASSVNENPPFMSTVGSNVNFVHIDTSTPTQLESGGVSVSGIADDYDGDARNATTPDIGADEFAGTPPNNMSYVSSTTDQITWSAYIAANQSIVRINIVTSGSLNPLALTQLTVNANGTTNISDINSSPAKVYYTGGSTAFSITTLFGSATPTIADFNVTGSQTLSEGDNYFWLAYDIGASATAGNVIDGECTGMIVSAASHTPSVTAPAGNKTIVGPLSGDYTVGTALFNRATGRNIYSEKRARRVLRSTHVELPETKDSPRSMHTEDREVEEQYVVWMDDGKEYAGPFSSPNGIYATITAAVTDAALRGVSGPVRFLLTDASYAETFPVVITPIAGTSAVNTVTIRPNTGVTSTIAGSSASSILKLNGASYIVVDGSNSGGTDRNLTISNTNTAAATAAVWLASAGAGAGATNNTIKNCLISCGADQSTGTNTTFGILSSGSTVSSTSDGADNNSNTFTNNAITATRYGIYLRGSSTSSNSNNSIAQNIIGPAAFGTAEIGKAGIVLQYQTGATVSQNEVRFVGGTYALTSGGADRVGIGIGSDAWTATATTVTNSSVTRNLIHDIDEARTFSAVAIVLAGSGTPSSNFVANNIIYNILANGTAGDQALGIGIAAGDADKVLFNSINMLGNIDGQGGTSTASQSGAGIRIASTTPANLTLKNNAVSVDLTSTTATINHYDIVAPATSYAWGTGGADYNDYHFNASNAQMKLGGVGTSVPYTAVADLATWKTQFTPAQDAASISADPLFSSPSNLAPIVGSPILDAGVAGTGVTVDYTGATRVDPPSMGAYENGVLPGPPNCATNASPADAATGVAITASLNWGNGGGGPTGYRLSFGTDNPPTNILNNSDRGNTLSYTPATSLEFNTTYYWKVVAYNGTGDATGCATWSFTTSGDTRSNTSTPDGGGYLYSASNSTLTPRPSYEWRAAGPASPQVADSLLTGTRDDDVMSGVVQLPAPFTFYGQQLDSVRASTNGFIVFVDGVLAQTLSGAYSGEAVIPTSAVPNYIVAGYWEDLDTVSSQGTATGVYVRWDAIDQVFTFQWNHFGKYNSAGAQGDMVFQINLYYADNSIGISYASVANGGFSRPAGSEGSAGIEGSGAATFGSSYFFQGDKPLNVPTSGITIKFATTLSGLPVQLTSFTARINPNGAGVRIDWTTASETNNLGFYVQRRVSGTEAWATVSDLIPGHGTTLEPQVYSFVDLSVHGAGTYQYRLRQMDLDGTAHYVDPISITLGPTDVKELAPREFALKQNYPNPFNPETVIKFSVENTAKASLEVYNLLGQKVATLFNEVAEAGQYYNVRLNGISLSTGMYIYRLQSGTRVDIKKMMLVK